MVPNRATHHMLFQQFLEFLTQVTISPYVNFLRALLGFPGSVPACFFFLFVLYHFFLTFAFLPDCKSIDLFNQLHFCLVITSIDPADFLCIYLYVFLTVCTCLCICHCVCLFVCLPFCLSVCKSVCLSIYLPASPLFFPFVCLSICVCACLPSICPFMCFLIIYLCLYSLVSFQ